MVFSAVLHAQNYRECSVYITVSFWFHFPGDLSVEFIMSWHDGQKSTRLVFRMHVFRNYAIAPQLCSLLFFLSSENGSNLFLSYSSARLLTKLLRTFDFRFSGKSSGDKQQSVMKSPSKFLRQYNAMAAHTRETSYWFGINGWTQLKVKYSSLLML